MRIINWILALVSFVFLVDASGQSGQRTLHRLVGGHSRIQLPKDHDDAEFFITSSAGEGPDGKQKKSNDDGEEKKTLSQQVADGKYGLIQNELFSKPVKRPGVLSYDVNPDVPKDNINNLGGLNKEDIWLAENHLLVIRGGSFPKHDDYSQNLWDPIDDYKAPSRQVKIPANPKVPPPFPVQLYDGGPLQILGTNSSTTFNGTFPAPPYALPASEGGFYPAFPQGNSYPTNSSSRETPFPIPPYPPEKEYGPPSPPFPLNGSLPPYFASLPPGAAILPPPNNLTDQYDEDDPSIYYPPPYSFYYQMDNTTHVPPGPLVPGIVLPPPPNFFAPLEKPSRKKSRPNNFRYTTTTTRQPTRVTTTTQPTRLTTTTEIPRQIRPTTTPNPPTPVQQHIPRIRPPIEFKPRPTQPQSKIITNMPIKYNDSTTSKPYERKKTPAVTILKPVKPSTQAPIYFYENNDIKVRPIKVYSPNNNRHRTAISSTQIPLKAYYSTPNDIDTNLVAVTQGPPKNNYNHVYKTTKPPAQYYYYEEESITQRAPKQRPVESYFNIPKEYYLPAKPTNNRGNNYQSQQKPQNNPYYYVRPNRPLPSRYRFIETTKKPDSFSVHVARLKQQIHEYYTTPDPYYERHHSSPKPVYQFSFQAANYHSQQQNNNFRASPIDNADKDNFQPIQNNYNVQIQPAIEIHPTQPPQTYYRPKATTERPSQSKYYSSPQPDYDYEEVEIVNNNRNVATPKPISEYSYQATPNPVYQQYYTKGDETYFDDITKKYFTIFGKKIPAVTQSYSEIEATTSNPLPPKKNVQIQYAQSVGKDVSLHGDTLINYVPQRPQPHPQAEYQKYVPQRQYLQPPASLHDDINVNYKQQRPPINQQAEIVQAIPVKIADSNNPKPGSYISYELPGDNGAHFYFLTPQLAQRRDQGSGFYYENPGAARIRRYVKKES